MSVEWHTYVRTLGVNITHLHKIVLCLPKKRGLTVCVYDYKMVPTVEWGNWGSERSSDSKVVKFRKWQSELTSRSSDIDHVLLLFKYSRRKGTMVGRVLDWHRKAWDQELEDLPRVLVHMLLLHHWVIWTKHWLCLGLPCPEKELNWRISKGFSSFLTLE